MSASVPFPGERIAAGASGTIYRAEQDGTPVAVKVLHPHLASDMVVRRRFLREAEVLSGLRHPQIVRVFDVTEVDGQPAMVTELLAGGTLESRRLSPPEAERLLTALAGALEEIHGRGITHRDIRPSHILFDTDDRPRIIDFGMASVTDLSGLTRSSVFTASPAYVDPYTWGRGHIGPTQDIYSLGAVIYYAITGEAPPGSVFADLDPAARGRALDEFRLRAGAPLGTIVSAMLASPAERPRSAAEVLDWLAAGRQTGARRLTECLYCGSAMPAEAPLCMECGREPLRVGCDPDGEFIALRRISEEQGVLGPFLRKLRVLSAEETGPIRLIIGDARLYSRAEQKEGQKLPVRIAEGIHRASVDPLVRLLTGDRPRKIRITRHPMSAVGRVKRGPLVRLREGTILPEATRAALRRLPAESAGTGADAPHREQDLAAECRYAVAIAARALAADPATENLANPEHISRLWSGLENGLHNLSAAVTSLRTVRLEEFYADLERLEGESTVKGERERRRIVALFDSYAEAERNASRLQQRLVSACRLLEAVTPTNAVEQLRAVEALLGPDEAQGTATMPDDYAGS